MFRRGTFSRSRTAEAANFVTVRRSQSGMRRRILALGVVGLAVVPNAGAVGRWTRAETLPHPRSGHAAVVTGGSIYVFGGPATAAVDRFDGRRWARATGLPGGIVNAPAAVAIGRSVYVIGGFVAASNE